MRTWTFASTRLSTGPSLRLACQPAPRCPGRLSVNRSAAQNHSDPDTCPHIYGVVRVYEASALQWSTCLGEYLLDVATGSRDSVGHSIALKSVWLSDKVTQSDGNISRRRRSHLALQARTNTRAQREILPSPNFPHQTLCLLHLKAIHTQLLR